MRVDDPTVRILYVALAVLMASGLVALGGSGAIAAGLSPDGPPFFLSAVAMILLTVPPIVLGAFLQWWPVEPWRGTGRRDLARMLAATVTVQTVGAALVLFLAADTRIPVWQPVAFLAAVAVISAINVTVAVGVRRYDALRPRAPLGEWPHALMGRKARTVRIWAFGTLVLATIGVTALAVSGGVEDPRDLLIYAVLTLSLACVVGSAASLVVAWPLVRRVREERAAGDPRSLGHGMVSGELVGTGEAGRTLRYARVLTSYLPFQVAQVTLLYAGLLLSQLPRTVFAEDRPDPASVVLVVLLIVTYAAFLPLTLRLWNRARAYAAEHEDVLAPN